MKGKPTQDTTGPVLSHLAVGPAPPHARMHTHAPTLKTLIARRPFLSLTPVLDPRTSSTICSTCWRGPYLPTSDLGAHFSTGTFIQTSCFGAQLLTRILIPPEQHQFNLDFLPRPIWGPEAIAEYQRGGTTPSPPTALEQAPTQQPSRTTHISKEKCVNVGHTTERETEVRLLLVLWRYENTQMLH